MNRMKIISWLRALMAAQPPFVLGSINEADYGRLEVDIRRQLNSRSVMLRFQDRLELLYRADDMPVRMKRYFIFALVSVLMYDLICINDYVSAPDLFLRICTVRLLIVTPLILALIFLIAVPAFQKYADYIAGTVVVIAIAQALIINDMIGNSPRSFYNIILIILVPLLLNILVRVRFSYALLYSLFSFFVYLVLILFVVHGPMQFKFSNLLTISLLISVCIVSNYSIEKKERREFLYKLLLEINSVTLEASNRELNELSNLDPLTGLNNRGSFDAIIVQQWISALREGKPLSLIFMDVDYFKKYNDNYGHQAGDECLKLVAGAARGCVRRADDLCARYGGEEFVVLLPHVNIEEAAALAERIRAAVSSLNIRHEDSTVAPHVTVSLGVSGTVPAPDGGYTRLIEAADRALYRAKTGGRNRVERD